MKIVARGADKRCSQNDRVGSGNMDNVKEMVEESSKEIIESLEKKSKGSLQKKLGEALSCLLIAVGALLASFSVVCILIPNDAIDYGTAGIAIILSKLTNWNLSLCVAGVFFPFIVAGFLI